MSKYSRFTWKSGRNSVGINVALEPLYAVGREAFGELTQGPKAARVPIPNIISAGMVSIADALFEF